MTAERCCQSMAEALAWKMLLDGEVVLTTRPLTEVNPDATVEFCPWCGVRLTDEEDHD